jgi:hypothetical protein
MAENKEPATLVYQLLCDDVRLEVGNKLSLMGIFQEIFVQQLPVVLPKIAIVSQWTGEGNFTSEVRILSPDRTAMIANSPAAPFQIPPHGYANNVTFFINLQFERAGNYIVQTLLNGKVFLERPITIGQIPPNANMDMNEHIH